MKLFFTLAAAAASAQAYWLMGIEDFITTERIDPVVTPGKISSHVHSVLGGSNFRLSTNTSFLRQSECSSIPIPEDKSNYWFPHLYFQWKNGSFTSLDGGAVIYYLFSDTPGTTTAFPDDFRMLSGDPTLRTYDPTSHAQQAITFLCLDFNGVSTKHNEFPSTPCPSGIRAQINFPSCWDGKNTDSPDHKSHVAFLSGGPDTGTCSDPKFPVVLPRIFMEVYWASNNFDNVRSQAMNATQPFVYSYGDPTGYGYHADFINGWDAGVLQKAVDNCHCNPYGDATCCVNQGLFQMNQGKSCRITKAVDEQTTGTLLKLPGNNPVQPFGTKAGMFAPDSTPALLSPIYAYTGDSSTATGSVVVPGQTNAPGSSAVAATMPAATPTVIAVPTTASSSSATVAKPSTTTAKTAVVPAAPITTAAASVPSVSVPAISIPPVSIPSVSIPSVSIPVVSTGVPSLSTIATLIPPISATHVLAPGITTTAIVAPATQPTSVAAPANGGSPATPAKSSSGKTCSSTKKRRSAAVEKHHHRRNFERHVRHLDYVYTN